MKRPETVLAFMSDAFKGLSEGVERLFDEVDKLEAAKEVEKPKKKEVVKPVAKAKPKKKATVKKKVAVRKAKKVIKPTKAPVTDEVLKIIKRYKKGIDITKLKEKTGFAEGRLRTIVSRAHKQGKIKRIAKGVYAAA